MSKHTLLITGLVAGMIIGAMIGAYIQHTHDLAATAHGLQLRPAHNENQMAPDFQLFSLDGRQVKLSDYRGKAVLLNFWASWCGPCKVEMPWFGELQDRYRTQGLEVIGVAADSEDKAKIKSFVEKMHVNYTILVGTDEVSDAYGGIQGLPTSFYINRDGRIVRQVAGLISEEDMETNIKEALKGQFQSAAAVNSK
jgi:peroxiredoxin